MKHGLRSFVVAAALIAPAAVFAGDEVLVAPPADWVIEREPAAESEPEPGLPAALLSLDTQVRNDGGRQDIYTATSLKILAPQGLSAGNLSFSWMPETQDLTVHKVAIRRGDDTIDVLASGQTFTVLRREQNLEQAMLDGTLTAQLFPDGLQVGDIVDLATTTTIRNPVTGDHTETLIGPLNLSLGRADVTISWREGQSMRLDRSADLPAWKRSKKGGFEYAEMHLADLKPVLPPRDAPLRFSFARIAQASDYASWSEVSRIFAPLYAEASKIPADGPLRAEVETIRKATEDPVRRAEMALELVQSRVRYVALLSGLGGQVPASAADTFARRYGDCKAKTALLMGILAELDIASEPVLVNTVIGQILPERLPAANLFDHLILRATIGGRDYWLDGTRTGDRSLARLETPYYEWGLPLRAGKAELVRLLPDPPKLPIEDFAIEFDAREGLYGDVPARLELVYRGDAAIAFNDALLQMTAEQRDRSLREFWRGRMDFVKPETVTSAFDAETGEMRLTLAGTAKMDWDEGWYETDYTGVGYRADFGRDPGPRKDAPFAVGYPTYDRTRQTILLPAAFTKDALRGQTEVDETVGAIHYLRRATIEDGRFHIERSERSVAPELAAADAPAAQKRLRELADLRVHLRVPRNYNPTESDLAAASSEEGDAETLVSLGYNLLEQGKHAESLELFDKATEADPANQTAWSNKGVALTWLNRLPEASVALDRAGAAGPMTAALHRARGFLSERGRDAKGAVKEYSAAIELDPEDAFSLGHRAQMHAVLDDFGAAQADVDRALAQSPGYLDMYSLKAYLVARRGDLEAARAVFDDMLAKNPDNTFAVQMARNGFRQFGAPERAEALGEHDGPETTYTWFNRAVGRKPDDHEGRLADLQKALDLDPAFVPALHYRAQLRYSKRENEAALADIDAAIAAHPYDPNAYLLKSNILRDAGRSEEAVAVAPVLSEKLPKDVFAQVAAAKIYDYFGRKEEALAAIDRALRINPEAYI
jgi:tetratricopeptide (TPR) repeat protein